MATPMEPNNSSTLMFQPRPVELRALRTGTKYVACIPNSRGTAGDATAVCRSSPLVAPAGQKIHTGEDSVRTNPRSRGTESLKRRGGTFREYSEDRPDVTSAICQEPNFANSTERTKATTRLPALRWPQLTHGNNNDAIVRNLTTATEQVQAVPDILAHQRPHHVGKFSRTSVYGTLLRKLSMVTQELNAMAGLAVPARRNVSNRGKNVGSTDSPLQEFAPTHRMPPRPADFSFCSDVNQLHGAAERKFKTTATTGSLRDPFFPGTSRRRRHFSYGSTDAREIDSLAKKLTTVTEQVQAVADVVAPRRLRHSDEVVLASLRERLRGLSTEKRVLAQSKIEDALRQIELSKMIN